jgi:hypothetical protein
VGTRDGTRRLDIDVGQLDLITAGVGEKPGDQGADLAGAQNEYAVHGNHLKNGWRILPIPGGVHHPRNPLFLQCSESVYDALIDGCRGRIHSVGA